jgi:hypothetical protein
MEQKEKGQDPVIYIFDKLKSGIGSCIALKAGLSPRPAKGRYIAGISGFMLWCSS